MLIELHERDFYFIKKDLLWLECSLGFITDCVGCVYILPFSNYCNIYLTDVMLPEEGFKLLLKTQELKEDFSISIRQTQHEDVFFKCQFVSKEGEQQLENKDFIFTWLKFTGIKNLSSR